MCRLAHFALNDPDPNRSVVDPGVTRGQRLID